MKKAKAFMLILITSIMLLGSQALHANANELTKIRAWEYKTYSRIVFDFNEKVNYTQPVILEEGTFTINFYDATTTLAGDIKSNLINKIEFVYQETFLTARINLPVKQFTIKSFSLSNPFRVVCDIYKASVPLKDEQSKTSSKTNETPLIKSVPPVQIVVDETIKSTNGSETKQDSETLMDAETPADVETTTKSELPSEANVTALATKTIEEHKKEDENGSEALSEGSIELNLERIFDTTDGTNMTGENVQPEKTYAALDKSFPERIEQQVNDLSEKITQLEQIVLQNVNIKNQKAESFNQLQETSLQDRSDKSRMETFLIIVLSFFAAVIIFLMFLLFSKKNRYKSPGHSENQDLSFLKKTNPFSFDKKIKNEFNRIKGEFDE